MRAGRGDFTAVRAYWGLRKYAGEQELVWGGKEGCEHQWGEKVLLGEGYSGSKRWQHLGGRVDEEKHWDKSIGSTAFCSLCGAWRGQFGLEPAPDCGRPYLKLRNDLTDKEKRFILEELKRLSLL